MVAATKNLPEGHIKVWSLEVRDWQTMIALQSAGLLWTLVFGYFLWHTIEAVRPDGISHIYMAMFNNGWLNITKLIVTVIVFVWLHEITHGIFFWLFTKEKPKINFNILYASCAMPGWYLPTWQYIISATAPFVILTIVGMIMLKFISLVLIPYLFLGLILNGGGSIGDLFVTGKIASLSCKYYLLIADWGSGCAVYKT